MINVEQEFDARVRSVGGTLVRDLVGPSPNFDNADYVFESLSVVAELKRLSKNQLTGARTIEKATEIYREALANNATGKFVYGRAKITVEDLAPEYGRRLGELYRRPIQGVIKKANRQIRQTKQKLHHDPGAGLLVLVNDGNTALDPDHIRWILNATLKSNHYSSINTVLYFTVNIIAEHPDTETDVLVWVTWNRSGYPTCPEALIDRLRRAWMIRHQELIGRPVGVFGMSEAEFKRLRNR